MAMCEDYPCCGHGPAGCPDQSGRFPCSQCGRRLPKTATSSICAKCLKGMMRRASAIDQYDQYGGYDRD